MGSLYVKRERRPAGFAEWVTGVMVTSVEVPKPHLIVIPNAVRNPYRHHNARSGRDASLRSAWQHESCLFERGDPGIQIGQRRFQNLAVARVTGSLQLLQDALAREFKRIFFALLRGLFRREAGLSGVLRSSRFGLLLFNGFGFPTASHKKAFSCQLSAFSKGSH